MDLKEEKPSVFKKALRKNLVLRAGIVVLSIYVMSIGFALYLKAELGSDCLSLLVDGLSRTLSRPYGTTSTIVNIGLFLIMLLFNRKSIGFATVVSAFLTGTFLQANITILNFIFPDPSLALRIIMPVLAAIVNAIGIGMYLTMNMGASPFEGVVLTLFSHSNLSYQNSMYTVNAVIFLAGVILGGIWGYGTLVAVALSGVLFQLSLRCMQQIFDSLINQKQE